MADAMRKKTERFDKATQRAAALGTDVRDREIQRLWVTVLIAREGYRQMPFVSIGESVFPLFRARRSREPYFFPKKCHV